MTHEDRQTVEAHLEAILSKCAASRASDFSQFVWMRVSAVLALVRVGETPQPSGVADDLPDVEPESMPSHLREWAQLVRAAEDQQALCDIADDLDKSAASLEARGAVETPAQEPREVVCECGHLASEHGSPKPTRCIVRGCGCKKNRAMVEGTDVPQQSEDAEIVNPLTAIVREADATFQRVGGGSRHWVRDCFLPFLNQRGWIVARYGDLSAEDEKLADTIGLAFWAIPSDQRDEWRGLMLKLRERLRSAPSSPPPAMPNGKLMLNSYGRQCYDAGYEAGKRAVPPPATGPQDGATLIRVERERQRTVEGWTADHDDEYTRNQLLYAARNYMELGGFMAMTGRTDGEHFYHGLPPEAGLWPWSSEWWKPNYGDPVPNLVKAGALIAAEIDRVLRLRSAPHGADTSEGTK